MVAAEIGEGAGRQPHAVEAVLVEAVRRGLDGQMRDAFAGQLGRASRAASPDRASSASRRRAPSGLTTPMVPSEAALWPSAAKIWRVNSATEVLPLVPVTATIVLRLARR